MTVVGEAFVAVEPLTTGFAPALEKQVSGGLSGGKLTGNLEKQFAQAGVLSGNEFGEKFTKQFQLFGLSGGALFGGALAVGAIAGLAEIGEQFQKLDHQIEQETGATGARLKSIAASATDVFRHVPESLSDAGAAVDELVRRGTPLGSLLTKLATQESFLAKITKSDLATNVESTTALFAKFSVATGDQSRELDVLFKASQTSGKSFADLVSNLQSGATSLSQFGFSLDQSAAFLATLGRAGVNIGPTLAALKLGLGKVIAAGGDPKQAIAKMFKEFTDGTPKAQAATDALALLGKRGGTELVSALQKGTISLKVIKATLDTLTNGKGGIVDTGLATLTLGDQFKLLRNNVEANLAGLGTTVLQGLETGLESLAQPAEQVATSLGHLVLGFGGVLQSVAPLAAPLALIGPAFSLMADGITAVTDLLTALPGPVTAGALAVAGLAFALSSIGGVTGAAVLGLETFEAAVAFATGPIGIALLALSALGLAFRALTGNSQQVSKEAKSIGDALFDTGSKITIFKDGIQSAAAGFAQYLKVNVDTKNVTNGLKDDLKDGGTNLTELARRAVEGGAAFDKYKQHVLDVVAVHRKFGAGEKDLVGGDITGALQKQGDAFRKAAQDTLKDSIATGQLSQHQVDLAIRTTKNTDGTRNYGAAIDKLNAQLAASAAAHDKVVSSSTKAAVTEGSLAKQLAAGTITSDQAKQALTNLGFSSDAVTGELAKLQAKATEINETLDLHAAKVVPLTGAYGALARAIAAGTITEADGTSVLQKLGFSADGAKTAFGALQSQVQQFVSTAVGALPSVADAVSQLNQDSSSDQSKLQTDLDHRTKLIQQSANASGAAQRSLRNQIAAANRDIVKDQHQLAIDADPTKFVQEIIQGAVQIATFQANLQKLVNEGFGNLAGVLATQGPKVAGALAQSLATNQAKAKVASAAADLSKATTDKYTSFLEQNFPALTLAGNAAGAAVGTGIAKGIAEELVKEFPQLGALGDQTGKVIGARLGPAVGAALTSQGGLITILKQHGEVEAAGEAVLQGFIDGINNKADDLFSRIKEIGGQVQVEIRNQWKISSPSKVAAEIGAQFVTGLGVGFEQAAPGVITTASKLADRITGAVQQQFGRGAIDDRSAIHDIAEKPQIKITPHPSLLSSGLQVPGVTPTTRLDAVAQQDRAQVKIEQNFFQPVDPLHVASELAWELTRRG